MGFWQSREDPSGVSGGWKEGSAWDEQGKRRKHGILAAFGEKGGGETLRDHCIIDLRRKPPRLGKTVRKPWKQWDSGAWKMGLSRGAGKKSDGKAMEVGKMDLPGILGILGPFPVGFVPPVGSQSQNPPSSARSWPGDCRKNVEKQGMKSAKASDRAPELGSQEKQIFLCLFEVFQICLLAQVGLMG